MIAHMGWETHTHNTTYTNKKKKKITIFTKTKNNFLLLMMDVIVMDPLSPPSRVPQQGTTL